MRSRGERAARGIAVLACIAVLGNVGSCSKGDRRENRAAKGQPAGPVAGGRLVIGIPQEPPTLNSILQITRYARLVENTIFSRFVTYDDSMRLVPDLITEIPTHENGGISADDLTYTYHLRPNARWHDGQPLTSADVVFTYQAIMTPAVQAESQQGWDQVERADAPDSHTVVFQLKRPYASFVADTFFDEDVLPKHVLQDTVAAGFGDARFNRAPMGSGPFRFKEWVPGSHITVTRNDDYYGGKPYLDEIVFKIVPDANALGLQLQAGELDGCDGAEASQRAVIERLPGIKLYRTQAIQKDLVAMNCRHPILSDVRVRRALAWATDRDALATHVYEGLARPARAEVHPMLPWYNPAADSLGTCDAARARRLLAEAGWKDANGDGIAERGGKPLRIEIMTTAGRPIRERVEAVLQQQWRQAGVDLSIHNYEPRTMFDLLRRGKFQLALFGWTQPVDPSAMEVVYGSKYSGDNGQNFGRYRSAKVDSLTELGTRVVDPERRAAIYREVQAVLLQEAPVIPLVWMTELDAMPERLQNFRPNPTDAGDTWNVRAWWLKAAAVSS